MTVKEFLILSDVASNAAELLEQIASGREVEVFYTEVKYR